MARLSALAVLVMALGCGCQPAPPLDPTYENVAAVFEASCSFRSCHGGTGVGAGALNFVRAREAGITYDRLLVSVPSCMYDIMPLVDPYHPENSWLMVKIAGPHTGTRLEWTPSEAWDPGITRSTTTGRYPSSRCPLTVMGEISFGTIMPQSSSAGLDPARVDLIRRWIMEGAPGPMGEPVGPRDTGMPDAFVRPDAPRDAARDVEVVDADLDAMSCCTDDAPPVDGDLPDGGPLDAPAEDAPSEDAPADPDAPAAPDAP